MKISIVIPVYNGEAYIERCVNSILNQTYSDIEIIIVNDGSTDKTKEICNNLERLYSNIKVLHQKNKGQASARNAGIKITTGEYIGFVDADDTIDLDMYEYLVKTIQKYRVKVALLDARMIYPNGIVKLEQEGFMEQGIITAKRYLELLLLHKGQSSLCVALFERTICLKYPLKEGKLNEDFLFWIEILQDINSVYHLNIVKYNYIVRKGSTTRSGFGKAIIDMVDNTWAVYDLVEHFYPELQEAMIRFFLYQRMYYILVAPKELIKSNLHCRQVLLDIKRRKKEIITNKYLTLRQKIALILICLNPYLFKFTSKIVQRREF